MSDELARNVHPLYAVMAFIAAIIVAVLLVYGLRRKTSEKQIHLRFFGFIIFYCIQDGIWGLLASGIINSDPGLMISSFVFHFSSALAPLVWTMFFCKSLQKLIKGQKIWIAYNIVLVAIELGMLVANFFNHFMFYVDPTGNYQSTPFRKILFYLQFSVYVLVGIISLVSIMRANSKTTRHTFSTFLWISATPIIFDIFQMLYPDAPANSAGLCIACVLVQAFLMQNVETQVRELEAEAELQKAKQKEILSAGVISTLSLEYGPLYLADLKTGSLEVFRTSYMERALPVQQLAFETAEYTKFVHEYANRHVIEADKNSFIQWTDSKHLDSIINTENISEFTYQRDMNGITNYYQFCCARVASDQTDNLMVFGFRNVDAMVKKDLETKKALEKALEDANVASKSKTEFLFNMSHDIRTPMNAILGFTDIAIKHKDDQGRVNDSLAKIKVAGGHLLNLINDILEMSRIESGTFELSDGPADLRKLLTGITQMSEALAIPKSIDFSYDIEDIKNPYVYIDELHWDEVIINLVSNAIKYTPNGGKVRLVAKQTSDVKDQKASYRFEIIDNGIGMSEEFQTHLFEAFSREKTSTVSKQEGAGLGLSIVKRIVTMAGGDISVKSKTGEGSTFIVDISFVIMDDEAVQKYEESIRPIEVDDEEYSLKGKKVLLVDDNEMNREIAMEILDDAGMIVETAEDGEFAVKAIVNKGMTYYDFVLMDIQMPVMDGYQATEVIRKLNGGDKLLIIALSANAFEEDIQKSLSSGMNAHIAKPIDVNALFETMQELSKKEGHGVF